MLKVTLLSIMLILAGCATRTQSGALIGGASGAAIGGLVGGNMGAIIGGAGGLVGGALIGQSLDNQGHNRHNHRSWKD